jgi:hypothetical protein
VERTRDHLHGEGLQFRNIVSEVAWYRRRVATALAQVFYNGLRYYHGVDRKGAVQLPPGVDAAHLDGFMHRVADGLAGRPQFEYLPQPQDPNAREVFRTAIRQETAQEVAATAHSGLIAGLGMVLNPAVAHLVETALSAAPPQFWTSEGSARGFHPADEENVGGLPRHCLRVAETAALLCDDLGVQGQARDEVVGAALVHDILKGGDPWNGYAKDHGPQGERFLLKVWQEAPDHDMAARMAHLVGVHKAQWNAPIPTPPQTLSEQILSYADFLPNLDSVYLIPPGQPVVPPPTPVCNRRFA